MQHEGVVFDSRIHKGMKEKRNIDQEEQKPVKSALKYAIVSVFVLGDVNLNIFWYEYSLLYGQYKLTSNHLQNHLIDAFYYNIHNMGNQS